MKTLRIDPNTFKGEIRPLNGVGGGPVSGHFSYDATKEFIAAGIPYCRTHDIEYPFGHGEFVDIHCIFKDFRNDVNDPEAYNFTQTDEYFKYVLAAGAKPFYRLGATIEHQPVKMHIHPPKDYTKWGEICSHIIAHYNEGWNNGFHMGIEYWEIWNEPDIPQCWTGTDEQMVELYDTAARVIKRDHPDIKLGGCAFSSLDAPLTRKWLECVSTRHTPTDFFSWHGYIHTPKQAVELSEQAAAMLREYGLEHLESIYDEWNYVMAWDNTIQRSIDLHDNPACAAFVASVIAALQGTRTDKSMYYDAQVSFEANWNGLFRPRPMVTHADLRGVEVTKSYYALVAWNGLRQLGREIAVSGDNDLYAVGASDGKTLRVLLAYYNDDAGFFTCPPPNDVIAIEWTGTAPKNGRAYITDSANTWQEISVSDKIEMEGNSFAMLEFDL